MKESNLFDFIILLTFFILYFVLMFLLKGAKNAQIALTVIMSGVYIVWGVYHHSRNGRFNKKILVEYTLFALIIIFIVLIASYI